MTQLEIAALTLEDASAARAGGAHSIEVSRDLSVGGLTPDFDLVRAITATLRAPDFAVNVMIRPHARDFIYTESEIVAILAAARGMIAFGVDGIVFGAQTAAGALDTALIARVASEIAPTPLTLHRALDTCTDPEGALAALNGVVPRVLSAGNAPTAWEGRADLGRWVARFGGHMRFVASGAIRLEQARALIDQTGAHELHIGGASQTAGHVDAAKVRALLAAIS